MPQVTSNLTINAPLSTVWELAQDVEKFPAIMPDLEGVKILESAPTADNTHRTVTEWRGRIKQFNRSIVWTEEDIWNAQTHECHFWQLKGDFTEYSGVWKFTPQAEKTVVDLKVNYAFEIPLIGALMKTVLQKLMQQNADMMAQAIKTEAEKRAG